MRAIGRSVVLSVAAVVGAHGVEGAEAAAPAPPAVFLQGFVRRVTGETIAYPWSQPGRVPTMISRATDGHMVVEWEGEPAPPVPPDEPVTYLWHAGLNSGKSGGHRFRLSVNGGPRITFMTSPTSDERTWTVSGERGETLTFLTARVTPFDERFGYMWLTAPRSTFGSGAPRFSVVGEAAGSIDYYLGPERRVEAWTRVVCEAAMLAAGGHTLRVEISHLGTARPAVVTAGGVPIWSGTVELGYLRLELPVSEASGAAVPVEVRIGGRVTFAAAVPLLEAPRRELHLLPHSHVDVGYSYPQQEVERRQWQNLRDAVELGRRTAGMPPEARFRWNVEGLWYVESYLAQAGQAERDRLLAAVRDGTIGLQASATGILTGLCTPDELRRWTDVARRLRRAYGLPPIRSVMQSDVPGLAWTAAAALSEAGVRYVSSGPNYFPGLPGGGDRIGGTLEELGDRPFWWVSPSGEERVLFWMAGLGYSAFHGMNAGVAASETELAILDYVHELAEKRYPWDLVQVRYTVGGDNGPVDPDLPEFVRSWNRRYVTPRLVIDTEESLFAEMERRHGRELPSMAGDMTPYWEDGAFSTAAEEAMALASARRLAQAETLWALRSPASFPWRDAAAAWHDQIMWHEHTWGSGDSVEEPDRPDVVAQWVFKRRFATDADRLSRELLDAAAPPEGPAVEVENTGSWPRSGLVVLPSALSRGGDRVRAAGGASVPSQRLADGSLAVWLDGVPALGAVRLEISHGGPFPPDRALDAGPLGGDTGAVRIELDPSSGAVTGLFAAAAPDRNLVDGEGLLAYRYVAGSDPAAAAGPASATVALVDAGPLVATWRITATAPGVRALVRTVRVVAGSSDVDLEADLDKIPVREKESVHLAFPFAVPEGVIRIDAGEAVLEPGRNQLPGSCVDFATVHGAADVSAESHGVSLVALDAPLLELGAITDERVDETNARSWRLEVAGGTHLYAYVLNNYWHTNYKADQQGSIRARFTVRPHGPFDPVALRRLGAEHEAPLLAFPVDPATPPRAAPLAIESDSVVLASLRPVEDGRALLLRLYNPATATASAVVRPGDPAARLYRSSEEGETGVALDGRVELPPSGVRTIKLVLAR